MTPSPRPGMLRSAPLRPDNPWSGMWGRCGANSGAINDALPLADPLSQGAQLYFSSQPRASKGATGQGNGTTNTNSPAAFARGSPPSVLSIEKRKMRAMQGDPFLPTRGCGPGAIGHRKPGLN